MAWLDASTRQEFPVPHCPPLVIVPANRFELRLKSLLPIWVLMAHSRPDSASCRVRAPSGKYVRPMELIRDAMVGAEASTPISCRVRAPLENEYTTRSPRQPAPVAQRNGSFTVPDAALVPSPFQSYWRVTAVAVCPVAIASKGEA